MIWPSWSLLFAGPSVRHYILATAVTGTASRPASRLAASTKLGRIFHVSISWAEGDMVMTLWAEGSLVGRTVHNRCSQAKRLCWINHNYMFVCIVWIRYIILYLYRLHIALESQYTLYVLLVEFVTTLVVWTYSVLLHVSGALLDNFTVSILATDSYNIG